MEGHAEGSAITMEGVDEAIDPSVDSPRFRSRFNSPTSSERGGGDPPLNIDQYDARYPRGDDEVTSSATSSMLTSTGALSEEWDSSTQAVRAENVEDRDLTVRGILVGLALGSLLCFSNTYFGLQTGEYYHEDLFHDFLANTQAQLDADIFRLDNEFTTFPIVRRADSIGQVG
jgi:hypothetical protein